MDNVLPIVCRDFPDLEATHVFHAGLPVYFLRLLVEVLEPQKLTSFESYLLHAIALGVNTREEIATLLGVDDRDLVAPGASLLKREYIVQGQPTASGRRPILLTEKGRTALNEQQALPVPMRRGVQLHLNALTWELRPLLEDTWSVERMGKEGLSLLPTRQPERPTLGDFTKANVAVALRDSDFFRKKQVIDLLELTKVTLEYLAPVTVVQLRKPGTQELRLVIYWKGMRQHTESDALQRLFETGHFQLPGDVVALVSEPLSLPRSLPLAVTRVIQHLTENEAARSRLQVDLSGVQARSWTTQDRQERAELEAQVQRLQDELRAKRKESERLREQLKQNQGTFLRTEEHRALLERTLKEAREEVVIISPWMNRRACDDALCDLVAQAVNRGVRVRIGYGITERAGDPDAGRNHANAQRVIRELKKAVERVAPPERRELLDIKKTSGTHEKILVCDRAFAVLGSFNWLSYRGEVDKEYRNETSVLLRDSDSVRELARIALREWPA
jgi:hypothetical protein